MSCDPCCERDVNRFVCEAAPQLECLLNKALVHNEFPGFSLGIWACGSTPYELNLGVKNVAGDPITSDTVFQSGAVAMPFLAAWLAQKITEDLPNPILQKQFPQGFNTRVSRFGDIRAAGPYSAFQFNLHNSMAHELVINTMNPQVLPVSHDLFLPHSYDESSYPPFEETNPLYSGFPWNFQFVQQIEDLNYVLPDAMAKVVAEKLGVNLVTDLTAFLTTKLGLSPTDGVYGKAAFQALPDIAEPLIKQGGDWKAKYVYDGDNLIASLGLSMNLKGLLRFLELYANKGQLDGEQIIDCQILSETLAQRTSMVINPFPGQWDSTTGWKHVITDRCRNRVVTMMTYLQPGGRCLLAFWPERLLGVAINSNSMNAFPEAAAAFIINYFSSQSVRSATDEFQQVLGETEFYIRRKTPMNQLIERPQCREIDILGYWISEIGYIHFFLDGDSIKAQFHSNAITYDPALVSNQGNNAYYFKYVDVSGIPRLFSCVFGFDGQYQPIVMQGWNYGGHIPFRKVRDDSFDSCLATDPMHW